MFDPLPTQEQVSQLDWLGQRREYRRLNHQRIRELEGLPPVVDGRYEVNGKRWGLAVGKQKGVGSGLPMAEAVAAYHESTVDGHFALSSSPELAQELADLERDALALRVAGTVRHYGVGGVEMSDDTLGSEESLLAWTGAIVDKGAKNV